MLDIKDILSNTAKGLVILFLAFMLPIIICSTFIPPVDNWFKVAPSAELKKDMWQGPSNEEFDKISHLKPRSRAWIILGTRPEGDMHIIFKSWFLLRHLCFCFALFISPMVVFVILRKIYGKLTEFSNVPDC